MSDEERELRAVLADRYPRENDQRRIVDDAELDASRIAFDAVALTSWHAILREAKARKGVGALLRIVIADANNDLRVEMSATAYARANSVALGGGVRDGADVVLLLSAQPGTAVADELKAISDIAIDPAYPASIRLDALTAIDHELVARLLAMKPRILQITARRSASGEIVLVDRQQQRRAATAETLAALLKPISSVELVILDGCDGDLARALSSEIAFVIDVSRRVPPSAATSFVGRLYQAIGFDKPIAEAFAISLAQVRVFDVLAEEDAPLLWTRGADAPVVPERVAVAPPHVEVSSGPDMSWNLWPTGCTLRARFLDGTRALRRRVADAARAWTQHANIVFDFDSDDADAELRISFKDNGSWAYLGTDGAKVAPTQPTVNFGLIRSDTSDRELAGMVQHELGHVLGLIHEHQSPNSEVPWDMDAAYKMYMSAPNFWDKATVDTAFARSRPFAPILQYRPFDPESIMIYPIPKELTRGKFVVGRKLELSTWDRTFITQLYPPHTYVGILSDKIERTLPIRHAHSIDVQIAKAGRFAFELASEAALAMTLHDAEGTRISASPDRPLERAAAIEMQLKSGEYRLRIRHAAPLGDGAYTLTLASRAARRRGKIEG